MKKIEIVDGTRVTFKLEKETEFTVFIREDKLHITGNHHAISIEPEVANVITVKKREGW